MSVSLLIIDDEPTIRKTLRYVFEKKKYEVFEAATGTDLVVWPESSWPDAYGLERDAEAAARLAGLALSRSSSVLVGTVHLHEEPDGLEVISLKSWLGPISPLLTQQTGRPVAHARRIRRLAESGDFDVINYHNVSLVGGLGGAAPTLRGQRAPPFCTPALSRASDEVTVFTYRALQDRLALGEIGRAHV